MIPIPGFGTPIAQTQVGYCFGISQHSDFGEKRKTLMLRGIYAAASGMITQRERLDVIADNLANTSTTAFKRAEPISRGFRQMFAEEIRRFAGAPGSMDIPGGGSALDATTEDFSPGPVVDTGNPLDVAIEGDGFFVIDTQNGERYTRAGNFSLNPEGQLVTQNGHPVWGRGGSIFARGESIQIAANGDVLVDGATIDRLWIVDFPKPYLLTKHGHNLYTTGEDSLRTELISVETNVRAGALERSNVNPITELTLLMETARSYEAHQRVVGAFDELLDSAVNDIART